MYNPAGEQYYMQLAYPLALSVMRMRDPANVMHHMEFNT